MSRRLFRPRVPCKLPVAGLVPATHVFTYFAVVAKTWMPGIKPGTGLCVLGAVITAAEIGQRREGRPILAADDRRFDLSGALGRQDRAGELAYFGTQLALGEGLVE